MPVAQKKMRAFTLVEVIVVTIIIGVMAILAMPGFINTRERILDNEAKANLKLIQNAEKIYRLENNTYINCANTSTVNTTLKLSLPTSNWNYKVVSASATQFTAKGQRTSNNNCKWQINEFNDAATAGCTW